MEPSEESISSRRDRLNAQITGRAPDQRLRLINRDSLLDALQALFDECSIDALQKYDKQIAQFVEKYKSTIHELRRTRVNITDFEIRAVIGRGHFGEVHVVKEKQTGDVYAMKTLRKCDSLDKTSYDVERDIMAFAQSAWLTSLQYAFQDSTYLFFVMEYHPGGDLLGLLYRQGGTLPESAATFYVAEIVLALEDLHRMGFVHRDIKPDNILLDRCGHLKLVDFGSAAKLNKQGFVDAGMPVGTPDYVAPEVLRSLENKNTKHSGYGVACDFWSLGILAYELTLGKTPFGAQNTAATYSRVMNHATNLKFPPDSLLTQAYLSLIRGLLTDEKSRLNVEQIKQQPLFKNLHLDSLRDRVPPYVPKITSVDDTSNFSDIGAKKSGPHVDNFKKKTQFSGKNLPFVGFTYTQGLSNICEITFDRSTGAKDEVIKNLKEEMETMRRSLMEREDFEEAKLSLEKKVIEKTHKLESIESIREKLERDLASSIAEATALKRTLEIERKDRADLERKALDLIKSAKVKWETSERTKVEALNLEIKQQKEKINQLALTNKMLDDQLQKALKLENKHKKSLEAVEQLNRRSVVGLESRLERVASETQSKISGLQEALDEALDQKRILEAEFQKMRTNEKLLLEELAKASEDYGNLNSAANEAEKVAEELGEKVAKLEEEVKKSEGLKVKIEDLKLKISSCESNMRELQNTNLLLTSENKTIEDYAEQIGSLKIAKAQNEKKINELESKLQEEEQKCASLKKQLEESEVLVAESQQLKELRMKMWRMEKELGNAKIDKRIAERELKEAENQIKELNSEVTTWKTKTDENKKMHESAVLELNNIHEILSLDFVKLKESHRSLEGKLQSERVMFEEQKDLVQQLKNAIQDRDAKVSEWCTKANAAKDELASLRDRCQRLEEGKANVGRDLDETKKTNQRLLRELEDTKAHLNNNKKNMEALREACVMIENQVYEYEKINISMQAEKAALAENTEKLIKDLCKAKEDIQEAKKLTNEEKSLRLLGETKIKRLNEDIECLQNENRSYKDECMKYRECSNNLSEELTVSEEKVSDLEVTVRSYERQIEEVISECNLLKEEISQYLTQMAGMKESNFKCKQQIQDLKESKGLLMQRVEELEAELRGKISYYEEREIKHDSIIKQQTKLIDYLQVKIDEHNHKKKTLTDKLFGSSKKENQHPLALHVNYKDLELQLQKQKQINKDLQEDIYKLKAELSGKNQIKLARHKSEIVSPQTKYAMEQLVKSPVSAKSELFRQNSVQRMHHNIPHRFVTKLCKKPSRCDHCANQIMPGRDVSVCGECNACVHLSCAGSLKGTCGLPQGYAKHFKESLCRLNSAANGEAEVRTEGWIKVLSKSDIWEKRYAVLTGDRLNVFSNLPKEKGALVDALELAGSKRKVVLEPLPAEIGVSVANSDLPFVLKVEVATDCWPVASFVFMALSMADRDKWFKALQKIFDAEGDKYHIETITTIPDHLYANCLLEITKNIRVIGTDQGLYSYHSDLVLHIEGPSEVHRIAVIPDTNIVVMIANPNSALLSCDLNHLINVTQCGPCTKPALTYKHVSVKDLDGFHFLQASTSTKHQMFCAATSKQLLIVKYDFDSNDFMPLRLMDTAEPVGCVLFTEHTLIVGADKFFEIDLISYKAEEFLDGSDVRLKHAVKCPKLKSYPLAILQVADNPIEYLLCFNEFAVFVDEYGRSSREEDVKSSHVPIGFQFVKPYLYIVHFSGAEILKLGEASESITVELKKMRYLGKNKTGIYVFHDSKIKLLEGRKLMDSDDCSSEVTESDRFSFTSSIVQSLDGHLSDAEDSSIEEVPTTRRVKFSQTNL